MADTEMVVVTQEEGKQFAVEHAGGVALYGDKQQPAIQHQFGGQIVHTTQQQHPLVHMICWDEDDSCRVEVSGRVTLAGDEKAPLQVRMHHEFVNEHQQTHRVEPLDHTLSVNTQLAQPIHHALQMRTPLQIRFCNPWQIVSDYTFDIDLGNNRLISVRLTGATVATPQPCEEPCPPPSTQPAGP